jgi:acetyl esterase/lipase
MIRSAAARVWLWSGIGLLLATQGRLFAPAAHGDERQVPNYREHLDLSYYLDAQGIRHPIRTPADWEIRRRHLLAQVQSVMGPLPDRTKLAPLEVKTVEETVVGEIVRRKIEYTTEPGYRLRAFLMMRRDRPAARSPAILCLHQTVRIGKEEPAGLGGNPNLHYARHLAERGYVTLAPDYPSFGEREYDFAPEHGYLSGSMKAIWDNMRGVDLLQSLPEVDPERIGCMGHSLGGHNTMFTALFDTRIKALVSNCGFTRFHKYYEGKLVGWTSPRYMPRIANVHQNNPDLVPFDFTEIVAAFAPRPFLASSPLRDDNFEVSGVRDVIASALPIYTLYGKPDNLQANYPDCAHDFPEEVRDVAYRFFDKHLKP